MLLCIFLSRPNFIMRSSLKVKSEHRRKRNHWIFHLAFLLFGNWLALWGQPTKFAKLEIIFLISGYCSWVRLLQKLEKYLSTSAIHMIFAHKNLLSLSTFILSAHKLCYVFSFLYKVLFDFFTPKDWHKSSKAKL